MIPGAPPAADPLVSDAPARKGRALFLCPAHWGVRNVVHSGMLEALEQNLESAAVLAGTPDSHASWYPDLRRPDPASGSTATAGGGEAWCSELKAPPIRHHPRGQAALYALQRASFFRRYGIATDRVCNWWYRRGVGARGRMWDWAISLGALVGARDAFFPALMSSLDRLKRYTWDLEPARRLLLAMQPDVVVATSCVMWVEEPFLMVARELGIPTLGCIQSFDNLTSRSFVPECDHYAVWNQRMAEQLRTYYPDRNATIHVTGTPQFDFHVRPDFRWSRADTLGALGLSSGEHYLLYAANSFDQTPTEPELVEAFARRCISTPELADRRLLVRLHPQDDFARWEGLAERQPKVVISRPSDRRWSFSGPADQARLVNTIRHADVCLNMWSTMSLDAALLDTPVVCVGFALQQGSLEDRFCHLAYEADFYRPIIASRGVRLAGNMEELVRETVAYVREPSRDRDERRTLATAEGGGTQGNATALIAQVIVSLARQRVT